MSYVLRPGINDVVAEAVAASRSIFRREEASLTLFQAEAELVWRRVEGGVPGVELEHHRRSVGVVGGGEGGEAEDLLEEVVGGRFGRVIGHDDELRREIEERNEMMMLFCVYMRCLVC